MAYDQRSLDSYVDVAERITEFRARYPEGTLQPADTGQPWQLVQAEGFDRDGQLVHQTFVVYIAAAYRTADDPRPGIGSAWEVFPGRTPYTRGSELMNAETSAWGRAIVAVGAADAKRGVASRQEVEVEAARAMRNAPPEVRGDGSATEAELTRMGTSPEPGSERLERTPADDGWYDEPGQPLAPPSEDAFGSIGSQQKTRMFAMFGGLKMRERAQQVEFIEQAIGVKVNSRNDLSYTQAGLLLLALEERSRASG